jgi:hypothetical protein
MPEHVTLSAARRRGGPCSATRRHPVEDPEVPVTMHRRVALSAPAYELWVQGELLDELGIRDDGRIRVEIIGGEIVVSPGPNYGHGGIVGDIQFAIDAKRVSDPETPWRTAQNADFNLERIADGYIPDLVVVDAAVHCEARKANARFLTPSQIVLAVEVTSRWNANDDREPGPKRERRSKWNGYALVDVPFYLVVDRDPQRLQATLYSEPDPDAGTYLLSRTWGFGETIVLPERFGVEIPTDEWNAWSED